MSAKDYSLRVAALSGTAYITKVTKSDSNISSDDRREIPNSEFIAAFLEWAVGQLSPEKDELLIKVKGETVAEIKIFRDKLFKKG